MANPPSTNAAVRRRYEDGQLLNDGAPRNVATDAPANGAATTVDEETDVHVVTADGTNTVDLSKVAEEGRSVTVVHDGGAATPTVAFDDADFVATSPTDLSAAGDVTTVLNINGEASGWVIVTEN